MAKLILPSSIPVGRTDKQPVHACCMNPECRESSDDERFEFEATSDPIVCPKCGADRPPFVHPLVLIHFLTRNNTGKIVGQSGLKYSLACDESRVTIATNTNQEAGTADARMVNCPGCLQAIVTKKLVPLSGFNLSSSQ